MTHRRPLAAGNRSTTSILGRAFVIDPRQPGLSISVESPLES
ncbi:hypothetical protein [Aureimonas endophytica]|nr:hypothetical protein [Aureimonas endophytica]